MARRGGRLAVVLLVAVGVSFWTSFLVRTYAWLVILGAIGPGRGLVPALGLGKPPQLLFTTFSSDARDDAHPAALHGAGALRGDEEDRSESPAGGGEPRRAAAAHAFRHVFLPLSLPGVVNGCLLVFTLCLGFYVTPVLLGTPARHDDLAAHQAAGRGAAGVGLRLRARRRAARRHLRSCSRSTTASSGSTGSGAEAAVLVPSALAVLVAAFLIAPVFIVVPDVVLDGDLVRSSRRRATGSATTAAYFTDPSWLDPHAEQLRASPSPP